MPLIETVYRCSRPALILAMLLIGACSTAPKPVDNPYEREAEADTVVASSRSAAVVQLQNQALAAINESQYALAVDYLQRAINIEPRDAWSWHYLADIEWRRGDLERCLAMVDRAESYARDDSRLLEANAALRARCD